MKGNSVEKHVSETDLGNHAEKYRKKASFFRKNKRKKKNDGKNKVEDTSAEVIKNGGKFFVPGRRHHKALAAGSDHIIKFCPKFSVFLYKHNVSDAERDEFISGKKSENKMARFVDDSLYEKGDKNKNETDPHMKKKRPCSAFIKSFRSKRKNHEKSADRSDAEIKKSCNGVVAFSFIQKASPP